MNEELELVSVLSPCYNVAPYISRFLESLIQQTYKRLEIILVNDGSTDNTGDIIKAYIPKLEAEGYLVKYVEQENIGLGGTINVGLKYVTGAFLAWPDPDDWLTKDSINKRVSFLKEHTDVALVRGNVEQVEEASGKSLGLMENACEKAFLIDDFFKKLVSERTWFPPVCTMIRTCYFDAEVPDREIFYLKSSGQNWQMMLPLANKYPCWQLPDVLGYYCVRCDSHYMKSHKNYVTRIDYLLMLEETLENTLLRLRVDDEYIEIARARFSLQRFLVARRSGAPWSIIWKYFKQSMCRNNSLKIRAVLTRCLLTPNWIVALKKKK